MQSRDLGGAWAHPVRSLTAVRGCVGCLAAILALGLAVPAAARVKRQGPVHRQARLQQVRSRAPIAADQPAQPATRSFYPENVPGGVPGNLPFNNQIRKLSDPLNANGAGK